MTSEIQQQQRNKMAMFRTEKLPDYSMPTSSSSSQAAFHQLASTKLIGGDDANLQGLLLDSNSRSPTPFGGAAGRSSSTEVDQSELFQDTIENSNNSSNNSAIIINNTDGKHHAGGSVMGIFFKVWSLVKVTKTRSNANKMSRQNSENASQFQYISGEQFNQQQLSRQFNNSSRQSSGSQERHFRHSSSGSQQQQLLFSSASNSTTNNNYRHPLDNLSSSSLLNNNNNRLQISSSSAASSGNNSKNNSTSSGVSSSHSSSNFLAKHSNSSPTQQSANLKRTSLYAGTKRTTAEPVVLQPQQQANNKQTTSSWASKIKRSATTVNQAEVLSYASRYRFRRDQKQSQLSQRQQLLEQQQQQADQLLLLTNYSNSNSNDETIEDDYFVMNQDDNESNDVYTTPNDSIQSVPSTANPQLTTTTNQNPTTNNSDYSNRNQLNFNPIIKSFSANNFNNLIVNFKQQQTTVAVDAKGNNFSTIQEQQQQANEINNSVDNNKTQNPNNKSSKRELSLNKSLNGSRFFISSSSSEDSNCPNQKSHQQTAPGVADKQQEVVYQSPSEPPIAEILDNSTGRPINQEDGQLVVPLQMGIHYHAPANANNSIAFVNRPDFLILNNNQQQQSGDIFAPILMPTSINGGQIAAMSPVELSQPLNNICRLGGTTSNYKKSPSLFEMSSMNQQQQQQPVAAGCRLLNINNHHMMLPTRFSSKYPLQQQQQAPLSSFKQPKQQTVAVHAPPTNDIVLGANYIKNSISFNDFNLSSGAAASSKSSLFCKPAATAIQQHNNNNNNNDYNDVDYRLTEMLLEFGTNKSARDENGHTALMQAVISDNLPAVKCLIEHQVDLNETNNLGESSLDLLCNKTPTETRLRILNLLIESGANLDLARKCDNTRLLDRLIGEHSLSFCFTPRHHQHHQQQQPHEHQEGTSFITNYYNSNDKLAYIDCLLQNGAKLGSSTWLAAFGKHEIQLRLLKKLCQDGYFLYKQSSIEQAVYRFEYALRRLSELEQQLIQGACFHVCNNQYQSQSNHPFNQSTSKNPQQHQLTLQAGKQIKYQVYLGLSRCERKRKFYKRALEFAHMAILIDSTSYEGFYSKAHILKDLREFDESLLAIEQTVRLVDSSIESIELELKQLEKQEESLIFEKCFNILSDSKQTKDWIDGTRLELYNNLNYLQQAKRYISKLKDETLEDKLRISISSQQ